MSSTLTASANMNGLVNAELLKQKLLELKDKAAELEQPLMQSISLDQKTDLVKRLNTREGIIALSQVILSREDRELVLSDVRYMIKSVFLDRGLTANDIETYSDRILQSVKVELDLQEAFIALGKPVVARTEVE